MSTLSHGLAAFLEIWLTTNQKTMETLNPEGLGASI